MKRLLISIFISLSIFGLLFFFWIKNKNDQVNRETFIPRFSTSDLPSGKVGEYYDAELTGLLVGAKAELEIVGLQTPVWLNLSDCEQNFDIDLVPKPNTFLKCQLRGYPEKSEVFESSFELGAKDYTNKVIGKFEINITQ